MGPSSEASGDGSASPEPSVSAVPESEPNDDSDHAQRLPVGRPVAGAVAGGDRDVFVLPPGDGAVDLTITADGAVTVTVARPQDASRFVVAVSAGEPRRLSGLLRSATLEVSVEGSGSYGLDAVVSEDVRPACGFALEPDDAGSPGAIAASVPATLVGCVATPDDVDVFRIPPEAVAELEGLGVALSPLPGVALGLTIRSSAGETLASLSGREGEELALPNLRAPVAGGLEVEVRSLAGANESTPYRLSLRRLAPLNGVTELEPNDVQASATALDSIGLVNGYLHRLGDIDYYRLTSPEAAQVRLLADPPEGVDLQLQFLGGAGFVVDAARAGEQERVCSLRVDPEIPLEFTVSARAQERTGLEPYLLHFERFDGEQWEQEPNEDLAEALAAAAEDERGGPEVAIRISDTMSAGAVSGYAFPPGDIDRFVMRVAGDPRAEVTYRSITIRLEPNGPADYSLEVFDADRAAVGSANAGRGGEVESLSLDLPSGLYIAQVTLLSGEPCDRPYRLAVAQTDVGTAPVIEGSGEDIDRLLQAPPAPPPDIDAVLPTRDRRGPEGTLPDVDEEYVEPTPPPQSRVRMAPEGAPVAPLQGAGPR